MVTSVLISFSKNFLFLSTPLWFPYSIASAKSFFLISFDKGSKGKEEPMFRIDCRRGHKGWREKIDSNSFQGRNSDPYERGESFSAAIAFPKFWYCWRVFQLWVAADSVNSNRNWDFLGGDMGWERTEFIIFRIFSGHSPSYEILYETFSFERNWNIQFIKFLFVNIMWWCEKFLIVIYWLKCFRTFGENCCLREIITRL